MSHIHRQARTQSGSYIIKSVSATLRFRFADIIQKIWSLILKLLLTNRTVHNFQFLSFHFQCMNKCEFPRQNRTIELNCRFADIFYSLFDVCVTEIMFSTAAGISIPIFSCSLLLLFYFVFVVAVIRSPSVHRRLNFLCECMSECVLVCVLPFSLAENKNKKEHNNIAPPSPPPTQTHMHKSTSRLWGSCVHVIHMCVWMCMYLCELGLCSNINANAAHIQTQFFLVYPPKREERPKKNT